MTSIKPILSLGDFSKFLECHLHVPQYILLVELIEITIKLFRRILSIHTQPCFLDDYK